MLKFLDQGTVVDEVGPAAPLAEVAFLEHFDALLALSRRAVAGVVVVAIDELGVVGSAFVAAWIDAPTSLVVGRHRTVDLRLKDDPRVALRQLVVLVMPGEEVSYRVIGLRPRAPLLDDTQGQPVHAFASQGVVASSVGRYQLFFLPTTHGLPPDANLAWKRVGARVFLEGLGLPRSTAVASDFDDETLIQRLDMDLHLGRRLLAQGEAVRGRLVVHSQLGRADLEVGTEALRSGLLLGRYERCETAGLGAVLKGAEISRIHLLVVELGGVIWAIDLASTNGLWRKGMEERVTQLRGGDSLALGLGEVRVSWTEA